MDNKGKIWNKKWFIITASILTYGLYAIFYYSIKKFGVKKVGITFCCFFLVFGLIPELLTKSGSIKMSYDTVKTEKTITVPEIKGEPEIPAVYGDGKTIILDKGNYIVGKDIPAGTYDLSLASGDMCQVWIERDLVLNESTLFDSPCSTNNEAINDGQEIKIEGDSIAFLGEGKIVKEAVPATEDTPAHDIVESIEFNDFDEICFIDNTEADCTTLQSYEELKNMTGEVRSTTTEKLSITGDTETCHIDNKATDCTELKKYDDMKREIIVK